MPPPKLADRLLRRVLPLGKRGDSMLGDLREEFAAIDDPSRARRWYWSQTVRLTLRYAFESPPPRVSHPRSAPMWFELSADLKSAVRAMRRAPGTSALIVLTLAAAIAGSTVGFTFADFALLRGLPVDDEARVVTLFSSHAEGSNPRARVSGPDFLDIQARATLIEQPGVMRDGRAALIRDGQSTTLTVAYASANVLAAMGQTAIRGRAFVAGDDRPGAPPIMLLSHRYWQREMASRDAALGQTLQIGREHFTVAGILSPEIEFGNLAEVDVWLPLHIDPAWARDARTMRFFARLKDGVSFEAAAAELAAISESLARQHPQTNGGWKIRLAHVSELAGGDGFWVVIALFVLSVGLLLAIATANVSNLVLARTLSRSRELAVRTALGARRGRLVRQFIAEGLVLCAAAAALSLPLAWGGLRAIVATSPELVFQQLRIDLHELAFIAGTMVICPLLFTIAPLRLLARPDMRNVLAGSGTRGATASTGGRGALVVAQVAFAVILLTISSLSLRSMQRIYGAPIGLDTAGVLVLDLEFNDVLYPSAPQAAIAAAETRDHLAGLPGVRTAAVVDALPILGDRGAVSLVLDTATGDPAEVRPTAVVTATTAQAAPALGMTVLAGAWFGVQARDEAVVSQAAAQRYFGGIDQAIGRRFKVNRGDATIDARIVGVSSDVAHTDRTSAPPPRVWLPLAERARRVTYVVRADHPAELAPAIRAAIAQTAPAVPIEAMLTLDEAFRQAASSDYVVIGTLTAFSLLALLLATTGLFGVVSFGVAQRTAEFGTRMALGASVADIVRLVARQSLTLLVAGAAAGLAVGVGAGFMMSSVLHGLSPLDPVSIGSVIALLAVVTFAATALPAWRASRIDPVVALRAE